MRNLLDYYKEHEAFKVMHDKDTDLYCVSYKHLGLDWGNPLNRMGRGLVLDAEGNIVSRGYDKFFNYLQFEGNPELEHLSSWEDDEESIATVKIDGSMVLVGVHNGELVISSSSSISNSYTEMFREFIKSKGWFEKGHFLTHYLEKYQESLVFEYTSPRTIVVIPYEGENLWLHGIVEKETGEVSVDPIEYNLVSSLLGVKWEMSKQMTKEELLHSMKHDTGVEGYVVNFIDSGKQLKMKTDWYFENHGITGFFFGDLNTKNKIAEVITLAKNDELDDYIALSNQRMDTYLADYLKFAEEAYTKNEKDVQQLRHFISSSSYTKREFIDSNQALLKTPVFPLVMAIYAEKEHVVEKLKDNYMEKVLKDYLESHKR